MKQIWFLSKILLMIILYGAIFTTIIFLIIICLLTSPVLLVINLNKHDHSQRNLIANVKIVKHQNFISLN
jgi:hypothetical protein